MYYDILCTYNIIYHEFLCYLHWSNESVAPPLEDFRIELIPERQGVPPIVKLDDLYKFVDGLEKLIPNGVPSLKDCTSLKVEGPMEFAPGVIIRGKVVFKNSFCPFSSEKKVIAARVYQNEVVELSWLMTRL